MLKKLNYIFNRKDKIKLFFLLIMIIIGSFLELTGVAVFMPFIEIVTNENTIFETPYLNYLYNVLNLSSTEMFLAVLAFVISGIYILKNAYLCVLQNCILKFSYVIRKNLAVRLLTTYMKEPYTFHLEKNVAELQRSLQIDTNQFMQLVNNTLQLIAEIMVCAVLGLFLFDTSHSMTGIVLFLLVVCVGFFLYISKKVSKRLGEQNQQYNAKLFQWVNQALGGIKEVKVLSREKYFIDAYEENYDKLIVGTRINELLAAVPRYIVEAVCITGLLMAVVGKMFWGYVGNTVMDFIPQLAVCAVGAFRLLPAVGKINAFANNILYSMPSLNLIYNDLKQIEGYKEREYCNGVQNIQDINGNNIYVKNVSYHYPNSNENVINKADLEIREGSTVAFIGNSGAGKTTLADIILGLLSPNEGHIFYGNMDIYENLDYWHSQLGYIPQNIYLSDDTIKNNVAFGIAEEEINEKAVIEALMKAQLLEFVEDLEEGINTYVGDRGVRLSGGQRQRIGIARALYHDPAILILDEATSALDNDTEQAVMEAIESLRGSKTMIIIAHRLTTIRNADIIYEVTDGKAVIRDKEKVLSSVWER